jgi:hypothetical protein
MRNISNVCLRGTSDVRRMANQYKKTTHGRQLRCYRLEEDGHGAHHLYLDILQNQVTRPAQNHEEHGSLTGRIYTTNEQLSQIFPISPLRHISLGWNNPFLTLFWQTFQHRLAKWPIRHLKLQQQTLLLRLFPSYTPQSSDEMTFRIPRSGQPAVDGDEDLLVQQSRRLSRP